MSFSTAARQVRDASLPVSRRAAAFRRCVTAYAPLGYGRTLAFLADRHGDLRKPDAMLAALATLDLSRDAWLAELDAFARRRKTAKAAGCRQVGRAELLRAMDYGWPGEDDPATGPLDARFLVRHGRAPADLVHGLRTYALIRNGLVTPPPTAPVEATGTAATIGTLAAAIAVLAGGVLWAPRTVFVALSSVGGAMMVGAAIERFRGRGSRSGQPRR
ncbi:hypothetical protein [Catellatospora sp. NPDC049133]|uniref:hypothetical protein n=1 Tax=Catellatospora sp. NPDC049133 TaxID=3155499 RepID=UPI0033D0456F